MVLVVFPHPLTWVGSSGRRNHCLSFIRIQIRAHWPCFESIMPNVSICSTLLSIIVVLSGCPAILEDEEVGVTLGETVTKI